MNQHQRPHAQPGQPDRPVAPQPNQDPLSGSQRTLLRVSAALLLLGGVIVLLSGISQETWLITAAGALMLAGGLIMAVSTRRRGDRAAR